jgi:hypothetical protein
MFISSAPTEGSFHHSKFSSLGISTLFVVIYSWPPFYYAFKWILLLFIHNTIPYHYIHLKGFSFGSLLMFWFQTSNLLTYLFKSEEQKIQKYTKYVHSMLRNWTWPFLRCTEQSFKLVRSGRFCILKFIKYGTLCLLCQAPKTDLYSVIGCWNITLW